MSSGQNGNLERRKSGKITDILLKQKSGEFDMESIYHLNLEELDLHDLGNIGECTSTESLNLSGNRLEKLHALAGLINLVHLDLSANSIHNVDGLQTLDKLQTLNLAGNFIATVEDLRCLHCLDDLEELRLKDSHKNLSNPLCSSSSYKSRITMELPNIKLLDGERLRGEGSDLYQLCNLLENDLKGVNDSGGTYKMNDSGGTYNINQSSLDNLSPDYFTLHQNQDQDDERQILQQEKQLYAILAECTEYQRNVKPHSSKQ